MVSGSSSKTYLLPGVMFVVVALQNGHHFAAYEAAVTPVPRLVGMANGVVLELGPGSGNQLPRFNHSSISRIYGIEPNEQLFQQLRDETIERHGLGDIYIPINAALEDSKLLEETWNLGNRSVDSVVCMQVLCSVSDPDAAAKRIYRLLKPGGQLLFWEHAASQDFVTKQVQGLWNLLWKPLVGGCDLRHNIEQALMDAGDWKVVELGHDDTESWQLVIGESDDNIKMETYKIASLPLYYTVAVSMIPPLR
ncbi:hypothetical protein EYB26_004893 [Talaromyces marneffei]|uniref:uncharacterized protein n=1 Tax=Talaromyces marneffei TaxID=37727 RepID=UPI0012AA607D|nr:uncharacterized protein EYB26_004893 [Talaromyces marneffei]QGA17223.1 hypothetical protein EYB26_004893 [Talaromyces marneffei]